MTLLGIVADEGTVVLLSGLHNDWGSPRAVTVAVDGRMAQPIADSLSGGLQPVVAVEGWQILGPRVRPRRFGSTGRPLEPSSSPSAEHEEASDKDMVSDMRRRS